MPDYDPDSLDSTRDALLALARGLDNLTGLLVRGLRWTPFVT